LETLGFATIVERRGIRFHDAHLGSLSCRLRGRRPPGALRPRRGDRASVTGTGSGTG
jgi:hypothetical protein